MIKSVKILLLGIATVIFFILLIPYLLDVENRSHAKNWLVEVSASDGGRYTAKYAYVGDHSALLRLYDTKSGELLAERTYLELDGVSLRWKTNYVIYSTSDDSLFGYYDGAINLPPGIVDRIAANLP